MRIYIPEIGTVLILAKPWTFSIVNERRNAGLALLMGLKEGDYYYPFGVRVNNVLDERTRFNTRGIPVDPGEYTWGKGTTLEVDRIYIRKGNEAFSSVTFKTRVGGKLVRFFARLDDVNRIEL